MIHRKRSLLFLPLLLTLGLPAQRTAVQSAAEVRQHNLACPPQIPSEPEALPARSQPVRPPGIPASNAKASTVSPILLGSASNGYNWIRAEQNLLHCDPSTGMLAHIHRQNTDIWGGGVAASGKLRYDISTDGGATWHLDIGELNTTYTLVARYPQITGHGSSTDPLANKLVWEAACLDISPDWDGLVTGVSNAVTAGAPTSTETYGFLGTNSLIPASLCHRVDGEYWMVDMEYLAGTLTERFKVMKGTYNASSGDVDWSTTTLMDPPYDLTFDGDPHATIPTMAWSPDGSTGWIALLGDVSGHYTFRPIFWKSTDAGATWAGPTEVNLNIAPWVEDTLKSFWVDSLGNPLGTGVATAAFEQDITVDINGNVHMGLVVGNAPSAGGGYTISSSLAMFMADIHTPDGGASWQVEYLAPVLTLRGRTDLTDQFIMENHTQAARNGDGTKVYFSWADTDTNSSGLGFSRNDYPNLRAVGLRVTDGFRTCFKRFTDGDAVWHGESWFHSMAPQTLRSGSTDKLFIGIPKPQIGYSFSEATDLHSFLNDTWFDDSEFMPASTFTDLSWDGPCYPVRRDNPVISQAAAVLHPPYPNPTADAATLAYELGRSAEMEMTLCNLQGQRIRTLASGPMAAGTHKLTVDTHSLPSGIYLVTLLAGDQRMTEKLVVAR